MLSIIKYKTSQIISNLKKQCNVILSNRDVRNGIIPDIRGTEETIDKLLSGPYSMSRLGDGEFMLIFGGRINYQRYDKELKDKLVEVLHSNVEHHIVCISDVFGNMDERSQENKAFWTNHLRTFRHKYYMYIDMKKTYYNTSATRVYKLLDNKSLAGPRFEKWKRIWDDQDIIFMEGTQTRMGIGNDLFSNAKSIRRIIGPAEDAFSCYKELLSVALQFDRQVLFILALGPTATILSYELARKGYRALDLGHIDIEYEWFRRNNSKISIAGKYVNEVQGGNMFSDCYDEVYQQQIVYSTKQQ